MMTRAQRQLIDRLWLRAFGEQPAVYLGSIRDMLALFTELAPAALRRTDNRVAGPERLDP